MSSQKNEKSESSSLNYLAHIEKGSYTLHGRAVEWNVYGARAHVRVWRSYTWEMYEFVHTDNIRDMGSSM